MLMAELFRRLHPPERPGTLTFIYPDLRVFTQTNADLIPTDVADDGQRRHQPFLGVCNFEQHLTRIIRNSEERTLGA
jgi:hypothetical protein